MERAYLYQPFVPVLLGGRREATRTARRIFRRHGVVCHWFGRVPNLGLMLHAKCHALPDPLHRLSDEALTRILLDFAQLREAEGGFLSLMPCSAEAEAYLHRAARRLESAFVLLPPPTQRPDPLGGLIANSH